MFAFRSPLVGRILAVAVISLFVSARAEASPDVKVGYVDVQKALSASKLGTEAQKKYEEQVKKEQAKLDTKKGEFEKAQADYAKQKDSLSEKARGEREEKLLTMERELKRSFQDLQEQLRRENMKLVGELVKKIKEIVDEMGKKDGYTVILEKGAQSVLYADTQIDLTDRVVKQFDEHN